MSQCLPLGSLCAHISQILEAAPIGWQLFVLESGKSDSIVFLLLLATYATCLLAQALRRWVNEGSPKLRMASRGGRRGLLRAQTPCFALWRARQHPREPEGAPRGPPVPERAAGLQQSPSPAQPRCRKGTWGPGCRV